jgi:hypothetical protein
MPRLCRAVSCLVRLGAKPNYQTRLKVAAQWDSLAREIEDIERIYYDRRTSPSSTAVRIYWHACDARPGAQLGPKADASNAG